MKVERERERERDEFIDRIMTILAELLLDKLT